MKLQEGFIINSTKQRGLAELITIQLCSILTVPRECRTIPRECSRKLGRHCIITFQFREDVFGGVLLLEYTGIFKLIIIV